MALYPLKFEGLFKERLWGGQKLRSVFGKDIPPFVKIGESWELVDLPGDKSVVANGELAGKTLAEVAAEYPEEVMGDEDFSGQFPLMIKFLDAEDRLSVQVHPDAATCERMGKGRPKTECWYVLSAGADSVLYKGLKRGVTREEFAAAIEAGTAAELLAAIPVKAGECHLLPAGTAHAIGAGLLIAEIQIPSDTTYRVFDWNRVDDAGNARELHIAEALESIHFDVCGDDLPVTKMGRLADCDYFVIDKGHQVKDCELLLAGVDMKVVVVLTGFGTIETAGGPGVDFKAGDTLLIPAGYEGAVRFQEDTEYLVVRSY